MHIFTYVSTEKIMKTSSLILVALLATSSMYAADINSYEVALTNDKVNYIVSPEKPYSHFS